MTRSEFFQNILGATTVASVEPEVVDIAEKADAPKLFAIRLNNGPIGQDGMARIKEMLRPYEEQFNCKFMVLQQGVEVFRFV